MKKKFPNVQEDEKDKKSLKYGKLKNRRVLNGIACNYVTVLSCFSKVSVGLFSKCTIFNN